MQWVSWNKTQIKQAWYRCLQLINSPKNYKKINQSYSHSIDNNPKLLEVKNEWIENIKKNKEIENLPPTWHLNAIMDFFDKYGIDFFEPLQIWHIPGLENEFIKRIGRKPIPIKESLFTNFLRRIKQSIINNLKKIKYGF